MEALVIALLATRAIYRQQDSSIPEPAEFQPFNLKALRFSDRTRDNTESRSPDRKRPYVPQTAS
jgi:hypothetical protein